MTRSRVSHVVIVWNLYLSDAIPHAIHAFFYMCGDGTQAMSGSDEDMYEIPLRDQRYFGAGLKRKRVQFVPSNDASAIPTSLPDTASTLTASEKYYAIVFNNPQSQSGAKVSEHTDSNTVGHLDGEKACRNEEPPAGVAATNVACAVCHLPISALDASNPHEASLAHQVCLPHAHPPSSLDRRRKGVSILQSYGWDPDQRLGLGAAREGILHPVKAKEKRDRVGLGVEEETQERTKIRKKPEAKQPVQRLDAGKIRKLEAERRKRDERLRQMFYSNDEVEKYLGGG